MIEESSLKSFYQNSNSVWSGIKKSQWQRAIQLLDVVHNVNYQGEIIIDSTQHYQSAQAKYKHLKKILIQQKHYFQQKYQISKYIKDQIRFCIFVPSYNNARLRYYLRNLDSIFQQQYDNYHLVYVNDNSSDNLGKYVEDYMQENKIPKQMYTIINNDKNQGLVANTYMAAHNYCEEGQVMVLLDGDDSLIGRQILSTLNAVYQKEKTALVYSQFFVIMGNSRIGSGYCSKIPQKYLQNGKFRQLGRFYTSHLKSMYVDLFRKIKKQDLQDQKGQFYRYAADVTYMTPTIQMAGPRVRWLEQLQYEYRYDTGLNDPGSKQRQVQMKIYQKKAYVKLQDMPFADNPKTKHYQ